MPLNEQEGYIPVDGYRVWYRIVGGGDANEQAPLMILHGGPGAPHDYLENLQALASTTRRAMFYDQLGCGRSDHPDDPALCTVARFADELETVRVPTLIISGRYDESTPMFNDILHRGIAGSEWVLLEHSSHLAHVEEPELYMQVVQGFLQRVENDA